MEKYIPDKKQIFVTEEFLEVVDEFVLTATNESKFYEFVKNWFSSPYNKELTAGFPVVVGLPVLMKLRDKFFSNSYGMTATSHEKRTFIQTMLYLHYVGNFVPEYRHLRITDFYNISRSSKPMPVSTTSKEYDPFDDPNWKPETLLEEAQEHLTNAQQHLKHVENEMNTLSQYKDQATTTVDLIHGRPVADWTEAELVQLIRNARQAQADVKDLVEGSERMKKKFQQLESDIAVYTKALDALPE